MLAKNARSFETLAPILLRVVVGITFLLTGLGKLQNPTGFIGFVTSLGIPGPLAWIVMVMEPLGGLLLILGLATRWVSLYFVIEMIITAFYVKAAHGTPFIQAGNKPGTGFELDLLLLAGAFVLIALGSGRLSVERNLMRREL